jgi:hypothetical protein
MTNDKSEIRRLRLKLKQVRRTLSTAAYYCDSTDRNKIAKSLICDAIASIFDALRPRRNGRKVKK